MSEQKFKLSDDQNTLIIENGQLAGEYGNRLIITSYISTLNLFMQLAESQESAQLMRQLSQRK